jgi:3-hydroxybutyryl-CoA dehydratase
MANELFECTFYGGSLMIGKTIEKLQVGDTARFSKTVSESDVYLFAGVTGDLNPAHINEDYAKDTFFKTRIVHGMLSASFISTVIGTMLPGPGTVYMRQEISFLAPVKFGDTVTAVVEVAEIMAEKKRVRLKTYCVNQENITVVEGEALVSPPRAPKKQPN